MAIHAGSFRELRLDRLGRMFGALNALTDVTLTITQGEFIALLGPSGCGKSTALNCLAGLLPATSGGIWLDERRIDTLRPEERGFGMVFQNYALFPHMTVRQNIGFGLKMRGVRKAEAQPRIAEAITLVRLQGHENKLPSQLSGGQQQRVAIARALAMQPALMLYDEPTSALDPETVGEVLDVMQELAEEGMTSIVVTHEMSFARRAADRVIFLDHGTIAHRGSTEQFFSDEIPERVARFLGRIRA